MKKISMRKRSPAVRLLASLMAILFAIPFQAFAKHDKMAIGPVQRYTTVDSTVIDPLLTDYLCRAVLDDDDAMRAKQAEAVRAQRRAWLAAWSQQPHLSPEEAAKIENSYVSFFDWLRERIHFYFPSKEEREKDEKAKKQYQEGVKAAGMVQGIIDSVNKKNAPAAPAQAADAAPLKKEIVASPTTAPTSAPTTTSSPSSTLPALGGNRKSTLLGPALELLFGKLNPAPEKVGRPTADDVKEYQINLEVMAQKYGDLNAVRFVSMLTVDTCQKRFNDKKKDGTLADWRSATMDDLAARIAFTLYRLSPLDYNSHFLKKIGALYQNAAESDPHTQDINGGKNGPKDEALFPAKPQVIWGALDTLIDKAEAQEATTLQGYKDADSKDSICYNSVEFVKNGFSKDFPAYNDHPTDPNMTRYCDAVTSMVEWAGMIFIASKMSQFLARRFISTSAGWVAGAEFADNEDLIANIDVLKEANNRAVDPAAPAPEAQPEVLSADKKWLDDFEGHLRDTDPEVWKRVEEEKARRANTTASAKVPAKASPDLEAQIEKELEATKKVQADVLKAKADQEVRIAKAKPDSWRRRVAGIAWWAVKNPTKITATTVALIALYEHLTATRVRDPNDEILNAQTSILTTAENQVGAQSKDLEDSLNTIQTKGIHNLDRTTMIAEYWQAQRQLDYLDNLSEQIKYFFSHFRCGNRNVLRPMADDITINRNLALQAQDILKKEFEKNGDDITKTKPDDEPDSGPTLEQLDDANTTGITAPPAKALQPLPVAPTDQTKPIDQPKPVDQARPAEQPKATPADKPKALPTTGPTVPPGPTTAPTTAPTDGNDFWNTPVTPNTPATPMNPGTPRSPATPEQPANPQQVNPPMNDPPMEKAKPFPGASRPTEIEIR